MFELHTPRLLLRDLVAGDWRAIEEMGQSHEVTRYQTWLRVTSAAEARDWVQQAIYHNELPERQAYNLAVCLREPQRAIGWLGWGPPSERAHGDYSFGYALLPSAWGRGYMTEALRAAIANMFERQAAGSVAGECAASNVASARVMEKCGLARVAEWEERDAETGVAEMHYRYVVGREAWQRLTATLLVPPSVGCGSER